jgi:predicted transposase/invertase (TIGR01784 family)
MSQDYDHTLKENIHEIFPALCKKHLGIEIAKTEDIKDKIQATIEREADFLQKVTTTQGNTLIVQLEFQTTDDPNMIHRMHFYWVLLKQKYKHEIIQYVIYIGKHPPKMATQLLPEESYQGFNLLDIATLDHTQSLRSNIPEEVIMAALSNVGSEDIEEVLRQIISRLQKLSKSEKTFNRYLRQLFIFARLRNFSHIIKTLLQNMAITYNIKEDAFYQEGLEKGMEKGLEQGKKEMVMQLIKDGTLTIKKIAEITGMTTQQIKSIEKAMK